MGTSCQRLEWTAAAFEGEDTMKDLALASTLLLALPAFGRDHHRGAPPEEVVVDRRQMLEQLRDIDENISDAMEQARGKWSVVKQLKEAREELSHLRDQVADAPQF